MMTCTRCGEPFKGKPHPRNPPYCSDHCRYARNQADRPSAAQLTADDVRAIRKDARTHREIADDFGITRAHVCRIRNGHVWRHVQ